MQKVITSEEVVSHRPPKKRPDPFKPHDFIHEQEIQEDGRVRNVNTIFLTNRECPFKCVMCDLWQHTLDDPTPSGAIPAQIEYALGNLPEADVIKLYNSGNFFDGKAIPRTDYQQIGSLISGYDHVIVENHPKLIGPFIPEFKKQLGGSMEIAMGLETIHPEVLPRLNKKITKENFKKATHFLNEQGIAVRAFILLNPPFLTDPAANREWCCKSVKFAFKCGATACSVIPTRSGNGIMERLQDQGEFMPPKLSELEMVFDMCLDLKTGRVFCDTWDLETFSNCDLCISKRKDRLHKMNLTQKILPPIICSCNDDG